MIAQALLLFAAFVCFIAAASLFSAARDATLMGPLNRSIVWMGVVVFLAISVFFAVEAAVGAVPIEAAPYRSLITRTAHAEAGLDAPVSTFAAQVTQESGWHNRAQSGVGARGLAQFMPGTARFVGTLNQQLADADVYNPGWSLRALIVYDLWLHQRITSTPECDRWAMTLAAYNGGLGWIYRDQQLAPVAGLNPRRWWTGVAHVHDVRSAANWKQNRDYPVFILKHWEPQFVAAGWGAGVCSKSEGAS